MNKHNTLLYAIIEKDSKVVKYGTITYTFEVREGRVIYNSLQITKAIRKKYGRHAGVRTNQNNSK